MRLLRLPALHIVSAPNVLPFIALSALSSRIESNRNWDALSLLLSAFVWDTAVGWMNGMCFSQVVRVEGLDTIIPYDAVRYDAMSPADVSDGYDTILYNTIPLLPPAFL